MFKIVCLSSILNCREHAQIFTQVLNNLFYRLFQNILNPKQTIHFFHSLNKIRRRRPNGQQIYRINGKSICCGWQNIICHYFTLKNKCLYEAKSDEHFTRKSINFLGINCIKIIYIQ